MVHTYIYLSIKLTNAHRLFEPMGICVSYGFVYNSVSISISPSVDLCINRASAKRRGHNHTVVTALPRNGSVRERSVKIENGKVTNNFQFRNLLFLHHHASVASSYPPECPCSSC